MAVFAFVLLVAVTNFAIGFALAVHFGHGPRWADLSQYLKPKASAKAARKPALAMKSKAH